MKFRYLIVGGNPSQGYTGITTFTGLNIVAVTDDSGNINRLFRKHYEKCSGLLLVIDTETSRAIEPDENGNF